MNKVLLVFALAFLPAAMGVSFTGCKSVAPPPPLATMGGPQTLDEGEADLTFAAGVGQVNSRDGNDVEDGYGLFGRVVYGLNSEFDLGVDLMYADRDFLTIYYGAKLFGRYQLTPNSRLELGLGVVNDTDAEVLGGDIGVTIGTIDQGFANFYLTPRYAYGHAFAPDELFGTAREDAIVMPNSHTLLLNLGTQLQLGPLHALIIEAAPCVMMSAEHKPIMLYYISMGASLNLFGGE